MTKRPNVVFVLTDDQGYGEIGAHGNPDIRTPHLDALHAESVRFTDFHVGTTCAPTRSGLLTGHNCNSTGVWHTIGGRSLLREDEWTLADALKGAGYRTGHFGKWHLGDAQPFLPHRRGFELSVYHGGGGIGNAPDAWGNDYFDDTYSVNGERRQFEGYCTDVFFREGMKFIEEHKDEPFFCYIATNAPHGPFNVEEEYTNLYTGIAPTVDRARFYGMVTNIDENVGKLRAKLDELGLSENTIVVFMTDNGSGGGVTSDDDGHVEEGPCNFNAGMRGYKGWPYEGGHRVPFFLHYSAGGADGGRDIGELTSYTDFMPTILDLCGVEVLAGRTFHGQSLVPLIRGDGSGNWNERALVADTQRVARPIKWRLSSVMKRKWRLLNGCELYDLAADPRQKKDIAAEHPDVVRELRGDYDAWWEMVSEQNDRDIPFALGETDETVVLTTHDLRNEGMSTAWHQTHVRKALAVGGHWEVDVRSPGRYTIELCRWPKEAGHALGAGIDGDDVPWRRDVIDPRHERLYSGGEAVPIRWARLEISGKTLHREVDPGAKGVTFEVDLPEGGTHLVAALHDKREQTMAPYYIYIDKMS